jgi:WD40 repeat protein
MPGNPQVVLQTGHGSTINQLTFSPGAHLLASHSLNGTTKVWDTAQESIVWSFEQTAAGSGMAPSEEFSPISISETRLLTGKELGYAEEVSMRTGTVSGRLIASPGNSPDPKSAFQGPPIVALAQSDDGRWTVVSNGTGRVAAFEAGKDSPKILQDHGPSATNLWFDSRSHRLLIRFEDKSTLFQNLDGGDGLPLAQLSLEQDASVAFSPNGDLLVLQPNDKGALLSTIPSRTFIQSEGDEGKGIAPNNVRQISCSCGQFMLSADGTRLATFEGDSASYRDVRVWTIAGLKKVAELKPPPTFAIAALSRDGDEVAFGGFDGSISLASVTKDTGSRSLSNALQSPVSLQWWSNGELAVVDDGGSIKSWNPASGSSALAFQSGPVAFPAISGNGEFIAARTAASELVLENVHDQKFESLGFKVEGRVASLAVSDNGNAVLWSSGDLAHFDIDQAIKWTDSVSSNLDDPNAHPDSLGTLISLPLNLAKRTPQGWINTELCRSKNNVPWGLFASDQVITAGCSSPPQQAPSSAGSDVEAMAEGPAVTVMAGSRFFRVRVNGKTIEVKTDVFDPSSVAISPDGHWASILGSSSIQVVDLVAMRSNAPWQPEEPIQESSVSNSNKAPQVAIANGGIVYFIDGSGEVQGYSVDGKRLFSMISLADRGWIVLGRDGRFDTSDVEESGSSVKWRMGDDPSHPLPVEVFMRDYFTPKLLPKLLGTSPLPEVRPLAKLNRVQPKVWVTSVVKENDLAGTVAVRVGVESTQSTVQKDSEGRLLTSGVFDVRLFRDGQIVGDSPQFDTVEKTGSITTDADRALWRKTHQVQVDSGVSGSITFHHVQLPKRAGLSTAAFTAYAFNRDRVKSLTSPPYFYTLPVQRATFAKARAYLITMGVDANQSRNLDLDLAVSSAEDARTLLRSKLAAGGAEVVEVPLYSERDDLGRVKEKTASKADLRAVLNLLAGKSVSAALEDEVDPRHQLRKAGPDDSVVLYIASHGYADPQGVFYLMPYDTGANWGVTEDQLNRCQSTPLREPDCGQPRDLLAHSISSSDLAAWWEGIDAGTMTMILDSCHSGAVPGKEFRPGPLGDPGFGQLSYDKGMQILSASQSTQTEKGTVTGGEARTILVNVLKDIASAQPQQTLEQWMKGVETTLPSVAKQLYPKLNENDVQSPLLLDFTKKTARAAETQQQKGA